MKKSKLSYNRMINKPPYYRFQRTGGNFDYFSPGMNYGSIHLNNVQDSYVIRDEYILTMQLAEMFNRELPEILFNGEYISKGIINVNKQRMYEYIYKHDMNFWIPDPKNANRYVGDINVVNYIVDLFRNDLQKFTRGGWDILGYRFRYIFPKKCVIYPIRQVLNTLYQDLKFRIICYSYFINPNPEFSNAVDIIVSNAPYRKLDTKKSKTMSSYINYTTSKINEDLEYAISYNWIKDKNLK